MNPPSQQVIFGNQQHPPVAPGLFVNQTIPDGRLWGSNVRLSMGITQIVCGGIEVAIGIAVVAIVGSFTIHSGIIWTGVFAIVAGFLGVFSLKKRCMVIAYMITSIITVLLCGGWLGYSIFGTVILSMYGGGQSGLGGVLALFFIMCAVFFIHMLISLIGACYTCGALSSKTDQSQQVVNYTHQPLHQQYVPPPSYTVTAAKSGIISQTTTPSTKSVFVSPII